MAASALLTAAAGCGTSQQERDQARRQAAEQKRLQEKAAGLREEISQLKEQQQQLAPAAQGQATTGAAGPPASSRQCGAGVAAGPDTSCSFALNTAREWVDTSGGNRIQVYSPATRQSYTMKCSLGSALTTCRGGKGAVVYIP